MAGTPKGVLHSTAGYMIYSQATFSHVRLRLRLCHLRVVPLPGVSLANHMHTRQRTKATVAYSSGIVCT